MYSFKQYTGARDTNRRMLIITLLEQIRVGEDGGVSIQWPVPQMPLG